MGRVLCFIILGLLLSTYAHSKDSVKSPTKKDAQGRTIMYGPLNNPISLNNVHIISKTYGVILYGGAVISNSVIEAPVCVQFNGTMGLSMTNNVLDCNLGVEFTENVLIGHTLIGNKVRGQLSNRPDVF